MSLNFLNACMPVDRVTGASNRSMGVLLVLPQLTSTTCRNFWKSCITNTWRNEHGKRWNINHGTRVISSWLRCVARIHNRVNFATSFYLETLVPSTHHCHHPSPPHSFTPGLKHSSSANPSPVHSLHFLLQDWYGFPGLFTDTSEPIRLCFFVLIFFHFLVLGSVRWIKLTYVSFWTHVK